MSDTNEIESIDTSKIEENVVSLVRDRDLAKNLRSLLWIHSYAVQFAVKTHDERLINQEKNKYADLQGYYETSLIEAIKKFEAWIDKKEMILLKLAFSIGAVIGFVGGVTLFYIMQRFI